MEEREMRVIVDVEATCSDDHAFPRQEMEIIEIGAVAVCADDGTMHSEFQAFIKPVRNPILTEFCRGLTTITQADVDAAAEYPEVIAEIREWLHDLMPYHFCSWGNFDRNQFEQDCRFHDVPYPFAGPHRNL